MSEPRTSAGPREPTPLRHRVLLKRFQNVLGPVIGLGMTAILLARLHANQVWMAFLEIGWGMLALLLLHQITVATDSVGWQALLDKLGAGIRYRDTLWIASIRNAVQTTIPVSASGLIAGMRLLKLHGVGTSSGLASLIVEGTVATATELLFIVVSLGCFLSFTFHPGGAADLLPLWIIVSLLTITLVVMLWAQISGRVFEVMSQGMKRVLTQPRYEHWSRGPLNLKAGLRDLYTPSPALLSAFFWQAVSLVCGASGIWYILILLHRPVSFIFALLLQGLGRATRSYGFLVPSGWGLQEGVFVLLAPLSGLTPSLGLALSLITRLRDLLFALPFLVSWHWQRPPSGPMKSLPG